MSVKKKIEQLNFDVVVIGGGLSGICAAIASARNGAKTVLVHARHVLGGNASSEVRMHILGASEKKSKPDLEEGGILHELMLENKSINDYYSFSIWDMVLFSKVKAEPNLTLLLNTAMDDCETDGNKITKVIAYQQTTEKHFHISGNVFIDCTGNGTLGFLSGAEYRVGSESKYEFNEPHAPEEPNNDRMGNTLLFKAVDRGHSVNFKRPAFAKTFTEEDLKYRSHSSVHTTNTKDNVDKSYMLLTSFTTSSVDFGYWWIELTGEKEDIIDEFEEIRDDLVACVYGVWDHLKNVGDHKAENYDLEWVSMMPGTRESRRLVGDYILNENDILNHTDFPDAVAYGGWPMDLHAPKGLYDFDKLPSTVISFDGAYTIPYRSYYSKNIDNLMMAGRNISASRMAMSSSRVMGTCAIGGQAAGTAAAMCKKYSCSPREILNHITELQQTLLRDDCYIPNVYNADVLDLAKTARISATSEKDSFKAENVAIGASRFEGEKKNIWISDGLSAGGETLTLDLKEKSSVSKVMLVFDSNFKESIQITMSDKRRSMQSVGLPKELVKDYTITLWSGENAVFKKEVKDNVLRAATIDIPCLCCDRVTITINDTYGCCEARVFEVRIYS